MSSILTGGTNFFADLLNPVYQLLHDFVPLIFIIIGLFLSLRILDKIRSFIRSKKVSKYKVGSTNNWFSWDDFEKWKEQNKTFSE